MPWLLPLLTKLAWWLLPKLIDNILNALSATLALVAAADADPSISTPAGKRDYVIQRMPGCGTIPEWAQRALLEFCVILNGLGVTATQLDKMEELVSTENLEGVLSGDKRAAVLDQFKSLFPDLPERIGRLLVEIAVAKVKAKLAKGAA